MPLSFLLKNKYEGDLQSIISTDLLIDVGSSAYQFLNDIIVSGANFILVNDKRAKELVCIHQQCEEQSIHRCPVYRLALPYQSEIEQYQSSQRMLPSAEAFGRPAQD